MAKSEWIERSAVWVLLLILGGVGLRDLGTFGRDRLRLAPGPDFLNFIPAEEAADLFQGTRYLRTAGSRVLIEGLDGMERDDSGRPYRHALGPATRLTIRSVVTSADLIFRFHNAVEGQDISVRFNGEPIEEFKNIPAGMIERTYPLKLRTDRSEVVSIEFARYNGRGAELSEEDTRRLAGGFTRFELRYRAEAPRLRK